MIRYDLINLSIVEFPDQFKDKTLVENLVKCVVKRWYVTPEKEMKNIIPIFGKNITKVRYNICINKNMQSFNE